MADTTKVWGLMTEFGDVTTLIHAAEKVRDAGYRHWDCHTPFPVHGLNGAMGLHDTKLPWLVFGAGFTGAMTGLVMQWWMNAIDYPIIISGKPMWSLPANIPVIFELTILFSALTAFGGMIALNGLPWHSHPLLRKDSFRRATDDRFYITIEATDPSFDIEGTRAFLASLGGTPVETVEE